MFKWILSLFKKKKLSQKEWWNAYRKYLASKKWEAIRQKVLKRDGNRCRHRNFIFFRCREVKSLQVHHLTYVRVFGNERMSDLLTLCNRHHKLCHLKKDKKKKK